MYMIKCNQISGLINLTNPCMVIYIEKSKISKVNMLHYYTNNSGYIVNSNEYFL